MSLTNILAIISAAAPLLAGAGVWIWKLSAKLKELEKGTGAGVPSQAMPASPTPVQPMPFFAEMSNRLDLVKRAAESAVKLVETVSHELSHIKHDQAAMGTRVEDVQERVKELTKWQIPTLEKAFGVLTKELGNLSEAIDRMGR